MAVETVQIMQRGTYLAADVHVPDGPGPHPAVVMAHGFGSLRAAALPRFAQRFREAGILAVVFDYRHFGDSGGHPRQLLSVRRQIQDWREVLRHTRCREDVDAHRTALWGTSFSGGHVVKVAASDWQVAAVVAQVPMASGLASALGLPALSAVKVGLAATGDVAASAVRAGPVHVAIAGRPGEAAVMALDEALDGYRRLHEGLRWENRVPARIGLATLLYRPFRHASKVRAPLLVHLAENDGITPPGSAERMARRAPRHEIRRLPIGHFDIYFDDWFETAVEEQTAFLVRQLAPVPPQSRREGGAE